MRTKMTSLIVPFVIAIASGIVGFMSSKWLGPDNAVEEECEKIIKDQTGADIDLSPDSSSPKPADETPVK